MYHEPIPAYDGNHPFIYACYCREDEDLAYPVMARLYNEGFRLWTCCAGAGKTDFRNGQRLAASSHVILFMSRAMNSLIRRNSGEMSAVLRSSTINLVVLLDDFEPGNEMFALSAPDKVSYNPGNDAPFWLYIYNSELLEKCRGAWPQKKLKLTPPSFDDVSDVSLGEEYERLSSIIKSGTRKKPDVMQSFEPLTVENKPSVLESFAFADRPMTQDVSDVVGLIDRSLLENQQIASRQPASYAPRIPDTVTLPEPELPAAPVQEAPAPKADMVVDMTAPPAPPAEKQIPEADRLLAEIEAEKKAEEEAARKAEEEARLKAEKEAKLAREKAEKEAAEREEKERNAGQSQVQVMVRVAAQAAKKSKAKVFARKRAPEPKPAPQPEPVQREPRDMMYITRYVRRIAEETAAAEAAAMLASMPVAASEPEQEVKAQEARKFRSRPVPEPVEKPAEIKEETPEEAAEKELQNARKNRHPHSPLNLQRLLSAARRMNGEQTGQETQPSDIQPEQSVQQPETAAQSETELQNAVMKFISISRMPQRVSTDRVREVG